MECISVSPADSYVALGLIESGLKDALDHSHSLVEYEGIIKNIENGVFGLWIISNDNLYVGFVITEVMKEDKGNWINIAWMYAKPGHSPYEPAYKAIVPLAKELGFAGVKFISSREGFERVAKKLGYKKRFVEYVVEDFSEDK